MAFQKLESASSLTSERLQVIEWVWFEQVLLLVPISVLVLDSDVALQIPICSTAIPHSGQLNIVNSTLSTPDLPPKSRFQIGCVSAM